MMYAPQSQFTLRSIASLFAFLLAAWFATPASATPPGTSYIYPAGGQRGTSVAVRIGGFDLYESCPFYLQGLGVKGSSRLERVKTIWFEGAVIPQPGSQKKEDYPQDYTGTISIAADAPTGNRYWNVSTSQGISEIRKFIVGHLPEIIEQEIEGEPVPVKVALPVTINGRIFPREDIDVWTVDLQAGRVVTCAVNAARIGSGLDSRLEIRDPTGRRIAENSDWFGSDSFVRFRAETTGRYSIRIHDVSFEGLQNFVYRLTVTDGPWIDAVYPLGGQRGTRGDFELLGSNLSGKPVRVTLPNGADDSFGYRFSQGKRTSNETRIALGDSPELLESEPNGQAAQAKNVTFPATLNGRIDRPGDTDVWRFEAKQGDQFTFDLQASRLGSPLDSVLTLIDSTGKQIATHDDLGKGQTDSLLNAKIPADGVYTLHVRDQLVSRGGATFAYRILATPASTKVVSPDFRITLPQETLSLNRGAQAKLKIAIARIGGFGDEIELVFEGLPKGVTATGTKVGKNQTNAQVTLEAADSVPLGLSKIVLVGRAKIGEKAVERKAVFPHGEGEQPATEMQLAIAVPTPFKFTGLFETKFAARGSVYVRHYTIDRGEFKGPLEVSLSDRQVRHLQGVTGPKIILPPDVNEFDFPLTLAPLMEIGRTSRTQLTLVGVVTEPDGSKHNVSYTSGEQTDQIIVLVDPGRLSLEAVRSSARAKPNGQTRVAVQVRRGRGLTGPVTVSLMLAKHVKGVTAKPVTIPADEETGEIAISFGEQAGPFNMLFQLRATTKDERGYDVIDEAPLTVVFGK
jgi:hypothetical protein